MKKILLAVGIAVSHFLLNVQGIAQIHPVRAGSTYTFSFNGCVFAIDTATGGRISSFTINDKEVLYTASHNNNNWGATLWPAPQSIWNWPPPDTLDHKPYSVHVENGVLTLKSLPKTQEPALQFIKRFSVSEAENGVNVRYTLINTGKTAVSIAPWQIARVPSGGHTFFPTGTTSGTGDLAPLMQQINGTTWFDYDSSKIPGKVPKLLADGAEGWMAHVNNNRLLLAFRFTDTPDSLKAPGEGEIELYTNPDRSYVELEQLGAYTSIPPNDSLVWNMTWMLKELPADMPVQAGDPQLIAYVRELINGTPLSTSFEELLAPGILLHQNEHALWFSSKNVLSFKAVALYDNLGNMCYNQPGGLTNEHVIYKAMLPQGLYHLVLQTETEVIRKKVRME